MNIQFSDMGELQEFLKWAGFARQSPAPTHGDAPTREWPTKTVTVDPLTQSVAQTLAQAADDSERLQSAVASVTEKPTSTRKRRTKAEIEAEEAEKLVKLVVEQGAANPADPLNVKGYGIENVVKDGDDNIVPLTTTAEKATDPAAFIAAALLVTPEVKQTDHLNYARGFIQKFGMAKYNETQTLAGLGGNVMAYAPKDCAAHMAAMQFVEQS